MHNDHTAPSWDHDDLVHGYWVIPGRLLATEYPGHRTVQQARRKLAALTGAGVTSFVDLTETGESTWGGSPMAPYDALLGPEVSVVGAWLIDTEGLGYPQVVERMQELRAGSRKAGHPVPDTSEQDDVLARRAAARAALG